MSFTEVTEVDAIKLLPIVGNVFVREAVSAHIVVDDEVQGLFGGDGAHWFHFDPLGVIVDGYNGILHTTLPDWE